MFAARQDIILIYSIYIKECVKMPRQARTYSDTGIYHIMIRGNEKKKIFLDDDDRRYFIGVLFDKLDEEKAEIYAYCLMDNHVHLLLQKSSYEIARLMKRINVSFVYYFNKKYKRVGHLFQDRFKSEVVDNENYLLAAVRYIHNNPVKAGIVKSPEKYWWSSYYDYINEKKRDNNLITEKVLKIFSANMTSARKLFIEFGSLDSDINFIDFMEKSNDEIRLEKENQAKEFIYDILSSKGINLDDLIKKENYDIRNELIIKLKIMFGLSARQIASIFNINKNTVLNIHKRVNEVSGE